MIGFLDPLQNTASEMQRSSNMDYEPMSSQLEIMSLEKGHGRSGTCLPDHALLRKTATKPSKWFPNNMPAKSLTDRLSFTLLIFIAERKYDCNYYYLTNGEEILRDAGCADSSDAGGQQSWDQNSG